MREKTYQLIPQATCLLYIFFPGRSLCQFCSHSLRNRIFAIFSNFFPQATIVKVILGYKTPNDFGGFVLFMDKCRTCRTLAACLQSNYTLEVP